MKLHEQFTWIYHSVAHTFSQSIGWAPVCNENNAQMNEKRMRNKSCQYAKSSVFETEPNTRIGPVAHTNYGIEMEKKSYKVTSDADSPMQSLADVHIYEPFVSTHSDVCTIHRWRWLVLSLLRALLIARTYAADNTYCFSCRKSVSQKRRLTFFLSPENEIEIV